MSKVKKDKRMSKVVSPKSGKGKGEEVAFNCDCCDEPVTVDELTRNHVTQMVRDCMNNQKQEQSCLGDIGNCVKIRISGRRFDLFVFDPAEEEEGYEMADS